MLAVACGSTYGGGQDDCGLRPDAIGQSQMLDGALQIGVRADGVFVPLVDSDTIELVLGSQGGWMVVPMLRVDSPELDDVDCGWVELSGQVGDGSVTMNHVEPLRFAREGRFFESDDVFAFLTLDLTEVEGQPVSLEVVVDLGDRSAATALDATLVNEM